MVPLLHHLRRQPLFLYVLSEVLAIMMGSTDEGGSLCSHSFRNNRRLPCLSCLRPRFHSVFGVYRLSAIS